MDIFRLSRSAADDFSWSSRCQSLKNNRSTPSLAPKFSKWPEAVSRIRSRSPLGSWWWRLRTLPFWRRLWGMYQNLTLEDTRADWTARWAVSDSPNTWKAKKQWAAQPTKWSFIWKPKIPKSARQNCWGSAVHVDGLPGSVAYPARCASARSTSNGSPTCERGTTATCTCVHPSSKPHSRLECEEWSTVTSFKVSSISSKRHVFVFLLTFLFLVYFSVFLSLFPHSFFFFFSPFLFA